MCQIKSRNARQGHGGLLLRHPGRGSRADALPENSVMDASQPDYPQECRLSNRHGSKDRRRDCKLRNRSNRCRTEPRVAQRSHDPYPDHLDGAAWRSRHAPVPPRACRPVQPQPLSCSCGRPGRRTSPSRSSLASVREIAPDGPVRSQLCILQRSLRHLGG